MTTAGASLDKCHSAGVKEGFEALEAVRARIGLIAEFWKCCQAEGTVNRRLYHCKAMKEERNKMPDAVKWCE